MKTAVSPIELSTAILWTENELADGRAYLERYPDSANELEQQESRELVLRTLRAYADNLERAHNEPGAVQLEGECHRCRAWVVLRSDTDQSVAPPPPDVQPQLGITPIARVTISGGVPVGTCIYAPGLPDGEHDLFPVPLDPRGAMQPFMEPDVQRDAFTEWLLREMPPGTVISNPSWWAPRIYAAAHRAVQAKGADHE